MMEIETLGGEEIRVGRQGHDTILVAVTDPEFGRIATVRLSHRQAAQLAGALDDTLVAAAGGAMELDEV